MDRLEIILKSIENKIGEDVLTINLKGKSSITDNFVIVTGGAVNHNRAICDEIEFQLGKNNMDIIGIEGYKEGNWILVDCDEVIVHIMTKDYRNYYNLERLWN